MSGQHHGLRVWAAGDRLFCRFGGVGHRGEFVQGLDGAIGQAGQHVGQIFTNGHVQLAATLDDAEDGGDLRSRFLAAQMQPVAPSNRDSPDILPMSVRNWRFTIVGTRFTGGKSSIEIANNAAPEALSTWTTVLAWSRWSPHGCWIP